MKTDPRIETILNVFGLRAENAGVCVGPNRWRGDGPMIESVNPANEMLLGRVATAGAKEVDAAIEMAGDAGRAWRRLPGPRRGEAEPQSGALLREYKGALGTLVTLA